ncbi:hypothetical protein PIB30_059507 [Stylosanthes scabra]|uniref:Uncharacterized protein n=1 Tax=Stylosanthes scabra TaxID=79078 RepID=A0ABU6YIG9_9FABA|nr:hypothetical protein [Stylosanthes scabra]
MRNGKSAGNGDGDENSPVAGNMARTGRDFGIGDWEREDIPPAPRTPTITSPPPPQAQHNNNTIIVRRRRRRTCGRGRGSGRKRWKQHAEAEPHDLRQCHGGVAPRLWRCEEEEKQEAATAKSRMVKALFDVEKTFDPEEEEEEETAARAAKDEKEEVAVVWVAAAVDKRRRRVLEIISEKFKRVEKDARMRPWSTARAKSLWDEGNPGEAFLGCVYSIMRGVSSSI